MKVLIFWEGAGWYVEVMDGGRSVWFQISDLKESLPENEDCFWWDELPKWAKNADVVEC